MHTYTCKYKTCWNENLSNSATGSPVDFIMHEYLHKYFENIKN